jgi:hypothetical protein
MESVMEVNSLESPKVRFIEACHAYTEGKHNVWTAQEYIAHWKENGLSDTELIERLDRESALRKPTQGIAPTLADQIQSLHESNAAIAKAQTIEQARALIADAMAQLPPPFRAKLSDADLKVTGQ